MSEFHVDELVKKYSTTRPGLNDAISKSIKRQVETRKEEDADLKVYYKGKELKTMYQLFGYVVCKDLSEEDLSRRPCVQPHFLPQSGQVYEYKETDGEGHWVLSKDATVPTEQEKYLSIGLTTLKVESVDGSMVEIIDPTIRSFLRPLYYYATPVLSEETHQIHNVLE